jgi:hypothetical protein
LPGNPAFVIPNGVYEVRNLSFLGILIEEGFIAQKTYDGKPYLASLGMTAKRIFQQPVQEQRVRITVGRRGLTRQKRRQAAALQAV